MNVQYQSAGIPDPARLGEVLASTMIIERSADFWYSDGNIVIQAEQTQFRIHTSLLSMRSNFFKDMFTLPQPEDQPQVDGCAAVSVHDTSEDWANLLLWIYWHERISTENFPVPILTSMLRLAKKYQLDAVRDHALAHLKLHIPRSLSQWEKMLQPYDDTKWVYGKEFALINLAEEFGINTILPTLYWLCQLELCNKNMDVIFDGQTDKNGTVSHLSPASQRSLVLGCQTIQSDVLERAASFLEPRNLVKCLSPENCSRARIELLKDHFIFMLTGDTHFMFDHSIWEGMAGIGKLCTSCSVDLESIWDDNKMALWLLLPYFFCGEMRWEDLVDFKDW